MSDEYPKFHTVEKVDPSTFASQTHDAMQAGWSPLSVSLLVSSIRSKRARFKLTQLEYMQAAQQIAVDVSRINPPKIEDRVNWVARCINHSKILDSDDGCFAVIKHSGIEPEEWFTKIPLEGVALFSVRNDELFAIAARMFESEVLDLLNIKAAIDDDKVRAEASRQALVEEARARMAAKTKADKKKRDKAPKIKTQKGGKKKRRGGKKK